MTDSHPEPAPAQGQSGDAFAVAWNPVPAASRVAATSRALRMSLVSSLIFPVVVLAIWFATGRSNQLLVVIALVSLGISAAFAAGRLFRLRSAQRALAQVPRGTAMLIDRSGLTLTRRDSAESAATEFVPWHQVTSVRAEGKSTGVGPSLVVAHPGGEWRAPLSFLDALPGTIDSALRAYSGARVGLDLSGLDSMW